MLPFLKYLSTNLIHHSFSLTNTSNIFIYKAYTSYSKYIVRTFLLKKYYRCDFENLYYEKKIILKSIIKRLLQLYITLYIFILPLTTITINNLNILNKSYYYFSFFSNYFYPYINILCSMMDI